jgi:hypothetical protein
MELGELVVKLSNFDGKFLASRSTRESRLLIFLRQGQKRDY